MEKREVLARFFHIITLTKQSSFTKVFDHLHHLLHHLHHHNDETHCGIRALTDLQISRNTFLHNIVFLEEKNSNHPKCGSWLRFFSTCQEWGWRWPGLAIRVVVVSCSVPSWLFNLAPTLRAVEKPHLWQSSCLLEPLPAHGRHRAPGQKLTHS